MNTDIRLSVGFWQHPKTKKTARRLGLEGVRSLQVLWLWAAQNRSDGTLSGMDWEDIELAADWQGEERKFFDTCLGMWIDETDEGYSLHDWQDHNPWQAEAQARSEKSQKAAQARWNKAKENNAQCSSDAQALHEHDSSNAPLLSFPEEKKEERKTDASHLAQSDAGASSAQEPAVPQDALCGVFIPLADGTEFGVPVSLVETFAAAYPGVDIRGECMRARAWCLSNPKQQKTKNGVRRFLNSWLDRAQNQSRTPPAVRDGPQQFKTAKMAESEGRGRFAGNVLAMMNARELEEQEKKNGIIARHCGGIGQDLCALSAT